MRRKSKQQKLTWCAHKEEKVTLSERDQQTTTLDEKHALNTLTTHKTDEAGCQNPQEMTQ